MKKIFWVLLFISLVNLPFAQNKNKNYKNLKKLKSKEESVETIKIRKPDNDALMSRKKTEDTFDIKINVKEKIKKSNKLLY